MVQSYFLFTPLVIATRWNFSRRVYMYCTRLKYEYLYIQI